MEHKNYSNELKLEGEKILSRYLNEARTGDIVLNNNYVFITNDGKKHYMVKFAPEGERRRLEIEKSMCGFIAQNTDIKMPEILEFGECPYGVYLARELVKGATLESCITSIGLDNAFYQSGQILAKLHSIHLNTKTKGIFNTDLSIKPYPLFSKEEYVGFLDRLCKNDVITMAEYNSLNGIDVDIYFGVGQNVFCHSDYNPRNILVSEGNVVSVIDFEWACCAPPWDDLATFDLFADLQGFSEKIDSFYKGYESIRAIEKGYFVGINFYKFYRLITMLSYQVGSGDQFKGDFQDKMHNMLKTILHGMDFRKNILNA